MSEPTERPALEVADVVRRHGEAFEEQYGVFLTAGQRRVLRDVVDCRTAALGGHVERCAGCAQEVIAYNSCRNRHCPKCQGAARARWLTAEAKHLLPVEYFHVVFTLPAELAALVQANPRRLYELLLKAARDTLLSVAADPQHLGAQPGILEVLHTWGQNLHFHPHVHTVVTGGGLSCDGNGQVDARPVWRVVPAGLFPAGADSEPGVSRQVFGGRSRVGRARLAGLAAGVGKPGGAAGLVEFLIRQGLGGVRQAAVWRTGAGLEVPGAVHASGGDQQPAFVEVGRGPRDVSGKGLRGRRPSQGADVDGGGVFASLRAARVAAWLREDSALWVAGQPCA